MIKFTNCYFRKKVIDVEDILNDLKAIRILIKGYKKVGDKIGEKIMRIELCKRKCFAEAHNIKV